MIDNGIATGMDQRVMGTIELRYPGLVRLQYVDLSYKGNPWWYMLDYYKDPK